MKHLRFQRILKTQSIFCFPECDYQYEGESDKKVIEELVIILSEKFSEETGKATNIEELEAEPSS